MGPETPAEGHEQELAADREEQADEVLSREGFEKKLMDEGRSEVGEDVPDVEE